MIGAIYFLDNKANKSLLCGLYHRLIPRSHLSIINLHVCANDCEILMFIVIDSLPIVCPTLNHIQRNTLYKKFIF